MIDLVMLEQKYELLRPHLNELGLRMCAAADALVLGRGGISVISKASHLSRTTIHAGLSELKKQPDAQKPSPGRIRKPGGGRKRLTESHPGLLQALEHLVAPATRGDPESPLLWTSKSTTNLANELCKNGYQVSQRTVWELLDQLGYSMQSNRKTLEGSDHPDRDAQFKHINRKVGHFQIDNIPVISVDTKKKELIGRYKNNGQEWQPSGQPEKVNVYDFVNKEQGKVAPYGVYDLAHNQGWVSVGVTHDTSEFAVSTIRTWWHRMGKPLYPDAKELLITADGGGSNGSRVRLWKYELQKLATELELTIHVCHFPPGTSKWNKIEHRMFCHITENWRGRPLESTATVVSLIARTTTAQGLKINAALDEAYYAAGIKISDEEMESIAITRDKFHGEWNYRISPKNEC
jgi:transposase